MQIDEIAALTNGKLIGEKIMSVAYIATDSRSLSRNDQVMFVAISGDHHNGNDYLQVVYDQGVRCFLTDQHPKEIYPDAVFCVVDNSLDALQKIASHRRKNFKGRVIAITGSNGKTIIKEWLYQLLQRGHKVIRSPRSYNSQLGVPLSVWQLSDKFDFGIIEAGISMPGEMKKLERIIIPDIGILTNIGTAHSENFDSGSQKVQEKLLLFSACKKLIFNADMTIDALPVHSFLEKYKFEKIDWSLGGEAKYRYKLLSDSRKKSRLELVMNGEIYVFNLPYSDGASVENLIHVITLLLELEVSPEEINIGLGELEPVEMRLEILNGVHGSTLVNDVYNSDLAGLNVALDVLEQQKKHHRRLVILSDVFQSGMEDADLYHEVAALLKFRKTDQLFCIGETIQKHKKFFPDNTVFYLDTDTFIKCFDTDVLKDAAVLIKGARKYQFEAITQLLQLQYHKTVLEINISEMLENLNYYRSLLDSGTKIMVMVKALSYGSGGDEIAGFLQHEKVNYLAVAFPDEGIRLRKSGVRLPIMVMNADGNDYRTLLEYNLEPELFSRKGIELFIRQSKFMGKSDHPVHIKLDTGMHRLGFEEGDIAYLCEQILAEDMHVASVFTHLVASDDQSFDSFTKSQIERFVAMADKIKEVAGEGVLFHVLNSAGAERFPEYQFDMVRIGIGLYGQGISKGIAPVSTFKTIISQVREVKAGDTIGYGRNGKVHSDSGIATIPVGYADGIDRRLGNGNYSFFVKGKRVPTIGNICMDMTMLDISDVDATVGDTVELFGENIPVEEMAKQLDTIVYEILTSVPERVKRVYIRE